jgi:hypothetical protein
MIIEMRKSEDLTKKTARVFWEELDDMDDSVDETYYFFDMLENTRFKEEVLGDDCYETIESEANADAIGFWEEVWPRFLEILAKEKEEKIALNPMVG